MDTQPNFPRHQNRSNALSDSDFDSDTKRFCQQLEKHHQQASPHSSTYTTTFAITENNDNSLLYCIYTQRCTPLIDCVCKFVTLSAMRETCAVCCYPAILLPSEFKHRLQVLLLQSKIGLCSVVDIHQLASVCALRQQRILHFAIHL